MGGGFGVITAEACEKEGLRIPHLEERTIQQMNTILPSRWSHANPIDLVGIKTMGNDPTVPTCLQWLMEDDNIDVVVSLLPTVVVPPGSNLSFESAQIQSMQKEYRERMELFQGLVKKHNKPLILLKLYFNQVEKTMLGSSLPGELRLPEYPKPRRVARVIKHLNWYAEYLKSVKGQ